jgi:hypothetical protein
MKFKLFIIISSMLILSGCPLEGDNGPVGTNGVDGTNGTNGVDGIAGLSCWDLNEDGAKTLPDEDTNTDGVVNVYDCRAGNKLSPTTTIVNSTDQTITNQHSRQAYSSASDIVLFTGTGEDYISGEGNWSSIDMFAANPIQDPCGLWKWTQIDSDTYALQAENSVVYESKHLLAVAFYTENLEEEPHFGYEQCQSACLSDSECSGAYYTLEGGTNNSLNCKLVRDVGFEIANSTEFEALSTSEIGFTTGNMHSNSTIIGVISVCE